MSFELLYARAYQQERQREAEHAARVRLARLHSQRHGLYQHAPVDRSARPLPAGFLDTVKRAA